ncbi:MAG: NAD(P)-dependent oxidoreductase, partial [Armatimonadota bacterium]|nr:NAD(P)-dependent oxidoreductase [Armatimonadota bacterium]
MRVLVTGAAGRVGSAVVPELAAHGHTVCALDNRPIAPEARREGVAVLYADITDALAMLNACAGFDAVVHAAAYP